MRSVQDHADRICYTCFEGLLLTRRGAFDSRLTQERKELISSLHGLAMSGQDDGYGSAVDKTDELRRNMKQEVCCALLCCCSTLIQLLSRDPMSRVAHVQRSTKLCLHSCMSTIR